MLRDIFPSSDYSIFSIDADAYIQLFVKTCCSHSYSGPTEHLPSIMVKRSASTVLLIPISVHFAFLQSKNNPLRILVP